MQVYAYKLFWWVTSPYTKTVYECKTWTRLMIHTAVICSMLPSCGQRLKHNLPRHMTVFQISSMLAVTAGVCVVDLMIVLPFSFPISERDLNVPWTFLVNVLQQSKPASLNICSALLKNCLNDCIILETQKLTFCLQIIQEFLKYKQSTINYI